MVGWVTSEAQPATAASSLRFPGDDHLKLFEPHNPPSPKPLLLFPAIPLQRLANHAFNHQNHQGSPRLIPPRRPRRPPRTLQRHHQATLLLRIQHQHLLYFLSLRTVPTSPILGHIPSHWATRFLDDPRAVAQCLQWLLQRRLRLHASIHQHHRTTNRRWKRGSIEVHEEVLDLG